MAMIIERPPPSPSPPIPPPSISRTPTLMQPRQKKKTKQGKVLRLVQSALRSLPILTPSCNYPTMNNGLPDGRRTLRGTRITGTIYGYRTGKVNLSIQETPKCVPMVVLELPMQTSTLQKEMSQGMVRIAMEADKRPEKERVDILEERMWAMYSNGKKNGYAIKKETRDLDITVLEILQAVSMGAGVIPGKSESEGNDDEVAYMRAYFERVIGSKDSETYYMLSPDGTNGPDLSLFFIRL